MSIEKQLEIVAQTFGMSRQAGHTYSAIYGVKSDDDKKTYFICWSEDQAKLIRKQYRVPTIAVRRLERLSGLEVRRVYDHLTVEMLTKDALTALRKERDKYTKMERKLDHIREAVETFNGEEEANELAMRILSLLGEE